LEIWAAPDLQTAWTGSDDDTLILWNLSDGRMIRQIVAGSDGFSEPITAVAFNEDGTRALTGSEAGAIYLWDLQQGVAIRRISIRSLNSKPDASRVTSIAFRQDGELAFAGYRSSQLYLWQTPSLQGLIEWAYQNRYIGELTCAERIQYNFAPQCDSSNVFPTRTPYPLPSVTPTPDWTATPRP
jgi:WD40 repeat protein